MRKFIVSNIYGNGDIYNTIMSYLENIKKEEDVELYINGDLIDYGLDSYSILLDVKKKIECKKGIKINYISGDHEYKMYKVLEKRKINGTISNWNSWVRNGGNTISETINAMFFKNEKCEEIRRFVSNLKICHVFKEKINGKKILLVHAQAPKSVSEIVKYNIHDYHHSIYKYICTKEKNFFGMKKRIGNNEYFTITSNQNNEKDYVFSYNDKNNSLNITSNCKDYSKGIFNKGYFPLLEIKENKIEILLFNHNNEILKGFYFDGKNNSMTEEELEERRKYIDHNYDNREKIYQKRIIENNIRRMK